MGTGKLPEWLTPEGLGRLEAWARDGLDDKELAAAMGISRKTFYVWKKEQGDICDAIRRGRGGAREQIENALVKKALGYTAQVREPVKVRRRYWNEETQHMEEEEEVVMAAKEIHIPPDPRAAQFWLTNRNRDRWAEHPTPVDGEREGPVVVIVDV